MITAKKAATISAAVASLCLMPSASAQKQSGSDASIIAAGDNFIQSLIWPSKRIGFKMLTLGSPINLDDRRIVSIYKSQKYYGSEVGIRPVDGVAIYCMSASIAAGCDVMFWNGENTGSSGINELKTAFGEPVKVKFSAFFDRAIPFASTQEVRHGTGRIGSVTIERANRSDAFVQAAVRHFTAEMGAAPVKRQSFSNAKAIYSPACSARVAEIESKPLADISIKDNSDYESCQNQALGKILSGNLKSTRTAQYLWSDPVNRVSVTIRDKSENIGGIVETASASIDISLDIDQQLEALQNAKARISEQKKLNQDAARRTDF